MKLEFSQQIFGKSSNIKFHESPSNGSGVVSCGETERRTDGWTDTIKFMVAFRNLLKAPNNERLSVIAFKAS